MNRSTRNFIIGLLEAFFGLLAITRQLPLLDLADMEFWNVVYILVGARLAFKGVTRIRKTL